MTPQLQQAIKLLQLSRVELEEMVSKSCKKTPLSKRGQMMNPRVAEQPRAENAGEDGLAELVVLASLTRLTRSAPWIGRSISIRHSNSMQAR